MKQIFIFKRAVVKICLLLILSWLSAVETRAQTSVGEADTSTVNDPNPLPRRTFNINPLGLLQFGPIVQGEFKINRQGYLVPHIRIPYLGVLYHVINWDDQSDDVSVSPVALGLGAGYKALLAVVFTIYEDDEQVFDALAAGASGYLLKNASPSKIIESLRELHDGGAPMSTSIARKVVASFHGTGEREKLSYEKLHVQNRTEALNKAYGRRDGC